ncbi:MAG TPA: cupin domain-containing protein [Aliidongia sp.]|nr:cupin domain-containing protein [Aliidongia sp.]
MSQPLAPALFSLAAARSLPADALARSATLLRHGTMDLRLYRPPSPDPQQPHKRDELYVVAEGSGTFNRAGERFPCVPGDVLFVAAGIEHRFEDFNPGFSVWVMFWGPEGGEVPA